METNLKSLNIFNAEINCEDTYNVGFSVCYSVIPASHGERDVTAVRDWISNGVELPPGVKDFPIHNFFVRDSDKVKYFCVVYWGDIE